MAIEAMRAKVLVYARGLKSLPSAPIMVNTGRKLTTVVATAVSTAPPTSLAARCTTSRASRPCSRLPGPPAASRCR